MLIANLIHALLLFEGHGYLVSSSRTSGRYLGIQDGFAYFLSNKGDRESAKVLLEKFQKSPLSGPQWELDIIVRDQDG